MHSLIETAVTAKIAERTRDERIKVISTATLKFYSKM